MFFYIHCKNINSTAQKHTSKILHAFFRAENALMQFNCAPSKPRYVLLGLLCVVVYNLIRDVMCVLLTSFCLSANVENYPPWTWVELVCSKHELSPVPRLLLFSWNCNIERTDGEGVYPAIFKTKGDSTPRKKEGGSDHISLFESNDRQDKGFYHWKSP